MKICKKICNQCPFRKNSLQGWLGPHEVDEILETMQFDGLFSCHMRRTEDSTMNDIIVGDLPICRGYVASASASFKLFGQNAYGQLMRPLQKQITQEDKEAVLDRRTFKKHHTI